MLLIGGDRDGGGGIAQSKFLILLLILKKTGNFMAHFPPTPARKLTFSPCYNIFCTSGCFYEPSGAKNVSKLITF
jgi:hypothetical protein